MSTIKLESEYDDLDKYNDCEYICYYKKDTIMFHNPYGPAVVSKNGHKEYWIENNLHRLDGPAIIYENCLQTYWINHEPLSKEEFEKHPERLKFLGKEHLICLL